MSDKFDSKLKDTIPEPRYTRGDLVDVKLIAKGGMAQIFRARQPSLDRFIAVKKLKDELITNKEMLERFRREAKALATVLHQNVAHVYDFVEGPRESYILMEYIDGVDVSAIIEKVGHLTPEVAACVVIDLARGVSVIHNHNLIHRDIKPSNIRITNRGCVKLMDFGIVMDIDNESLTRPGTMVGSPSYLSPEQVLGDPISPRADIFLIGIVFYEMLTGIKPFREEQGETVFQRIREAKYIPVNKMKPSIPKAVANIVHRCLAKNPDRRYSEVKELMDDVERFLGTERGSRTQDILLKFLDEEALVKPAVEYQEVGGILTAGFQLNLKKIIAIAAGFVVLFFLGVIVGRHSLPFAPPSDSNLVPLNQIKK